jgi:hypothetical protein
VTSCRLAGYVVTPDVASRNRIQRQSSSAQATSLCSLPSWSKTTSPTESSVGSAQGTKRAATTKDRSGVAGRASVRTQVRGVRVAQAQAHDAAAVPIDDLGDE